MFPFVISARRGGAAVAVLLALVIIATAGPAANSVFRGASYVNPGNWKDQQQGDTRVLIAPSRPNEVLLVMISAQLKIIKTPASDLETLVAQTEKTVTKASHGTATSTQAAGYTVMTMASKVEDRTLGTYNRIYELVSTKTDAVFVAVVSKGDATFADHQQELLQILTSCHPTSGGSVAPPAVTAIPYVDTPGKTPGDPGFRPSGHGKPIPKAAIVDGAPQGLWWTYTTTGSPTAYGTIFFPDGMALHYYRPGGPNLADVEGMKANHGAVDIGTWVIANGKITVHFGESVRSTSFSVEHDKQGELIKTGTEIYRPANPLTASALVGKWQIHGVGDFTFAADGTVQTTTAMIGSIHGLNYTDAVQKGTWFLDGYLLVLSFPTEGIRVLPVFAISGSQIVITSRFYMRT